MTKQSLTFMKVMRLLRFARNDGEILAIHGQAAERETSFQLVPMLGRGILKLQKTRFQAILGMRVWMKDVNKVYIIRINRNEIL